jgi:GDP-L-fucose synthase
MEKHVVDGIYNIGVGEDVTIRELAETVMSVVGFTGRIAFDASKPDGTPRKLLDVSRMRDLGWQAHTALREGIALAYRDFAEPDSRLSVLLESNSTKNSSI